MNRRISFVIHLAAVLTLVVTTVACRWNDTVYHSSRSCGNEWCRDSVLTYDLPTLGPIRSEIELRYDKRFPYRKVWLKVEHNLNFPTVRETDTIGVELYDKSGNPLGKGMAGIYQISVPFITFSGRGGYKRGMSISHCMSDDYLVGISDIGVRIMAQ